MNSSSLLSARYGWGQPWCRTFAVCTCQQYTTPLSILFGSSIFEGLRERTEHLDIFLFFHPSLNGVVSDVLFTDRRGVSDFSVLKCYQLHTNYSVNILSESLRILIDCSQLSKTYYNVLFGSSARDRHARCIYRRTCMTISDGRTKQLYIIAGFLPRHWLYE